jgi:3-methyladenine DNA glycosylase AlkD
MRKWLVPADFPRLERWLKRHVSNWGACDSLCGGVLGTFLLDHPQFLPRLRQWAKSKNRWERRAAAVAHIIPNRAGRAFSEAYRVADVLLLDADDMVQKGYGWMLKEMANLRPREVFEFVLARRATMPRTALRYAIEKMPAAWKTQAMVKTPREGGR